MRNASQDELRLRSEFTKSISDAERNIAKLQAEIVVLKTEVQQHRDTTPRSTRALMAIFILVI